MSTISIAQLNYASLQVDRYVSTFLLLFAIIGNLLCCLVFIQRTLRTNPCVLYFLIASISNIISLISGIPSLMLNSWNILPDRTRTVPILCKCRIIVLLTSRNIASWLLVFATIDRYLVSSSCVNIRRMSSIKQAFRWIVFVCIISISFWAESLYCFDANLIGTPLKCYAKSDVCRIFNDLAQSFLTTIIPSSVMVIFGLCTINNIHQKRRITPVIVINTLRRKNKTENNLTKILFLQVILLTIFNIPQAIQKFYLTYTFYQSKSLIRVAIENLIFDIVLVCTYIPNCIPFYLYILTSKTFQKTFVQFIQTTRRRFTCVLN